MGTDRAADLIAALQLRPHPEGGHFREVFRSAATVRPDDGRAARSALTTIDFLLARGQRSASTGNTRWRRKLRASPTSRLLASSTHVSPCSAA